MIGSPRGPDSSSNRRLVLLVVAGAALILGVIAFGLLRGDTFGSIDSSIKFLQASAFAASGFRSTALPYAALALDPGQMFVPFDPPYVFRGASGYESVFSSGYAILAAPVIRLGPGVLRALSIFGGAATASGTAWLAERGPRWVPAVLITFATPVWYAPLRAARRPWPWRLRRSRSCSPPARVRSIFPAAC